MAKPIDVTCAQCGKQFQLKSEWHYNYRMKRNQGKVFCSFRCGRLNKPMSQETKERLRETSKNSYLDGRRIVSPLVKVQCGYCRKELEFKQWDYNRRINANERKKVYCSFTCSQSDRTMSEETKNKLSQVQLGISVSTRGRIGHLVSEETKEKIRQSKKGKTGIVADWEIVKREVQKRRLHKCVITRAPIPDIIYAENNRLIAIEVEKKRWFTDIKPKMRAYEVGTGYDKVYLVWYNLKGEFQKEYIYEDGKWSHN